MADEPKKVEAKAEPKRTTAEELEVFWSKHVRNSEISRNTRLYSQLTTLKDHMVKLMGDK